jgi:triosephosphate isomerase
MPRKKLIVANWKMYKTPAESREFVSAFLPLVKDHTRDDIVLCPSFVNLITVAESLRATQIKVGAQDLFWEKEGAYTGAVSSGMLLAAGCAYVIIGHSERRQYFGETDASVNRKLKAALNAGLTAIVCVGESQEERAADATHEVLRRQCAAAFAGVHAEDAMQFTVAYEPIWAIGTGQTATPAMAVEAHRLIRKEAAQCFGLNAAEGLRILYGGSVKPENATVLMAEEEIDGALVGGASLDTRSFAAIVRYGVA